MWASKRITAATSAAALLLGASFAILCSAASASTPATHFCLAPNGTDNGVDILGVNISDQVCGTMSGFNYSFGAQGPTGMPGPPGPVGPAGPMGPMGPMAETTENIVSASQTKPLAANAVPGTLSAFAVASCPAGYKLTGGSARVVNASGSVAIHDSYPAGVTWKARAMIISSGTGVDTVISSVQCIQ